MLGPDEPVSFPAGAGTGGIEYFGEIEYNNPILRPDAPEAEA